MLTLHNNFKVNFLIFAIINFYIASVEAAENEEQVHFTLNHLHIYPKNNKSSNKIVDILNLNRNSRSADGRTGLNNALNQRIPYAASQLAFSSQIKNDDMETSRSKIKNFSSNKLVENQKQSTATPLKETKSSNSYQSQEYLDEHRSSNLPQIDNLNKFNTNSKEETFRINIPNQQFHNQAMQTIPKVSDYQGYETHHEAPKQILTQKPNQGGKFHIGAVPFEAMIKDEKIAPNTHKNYHFPQGLRGNFYHTNMQQYNNPNNRNRFSIENIALPHNGALTGNNYDTNIQHYVKPHQNFNHYGNQQKPLHYGTNIQHHETPQNTNRNAFIKDENNQMPQFEALVENQYHPTQNENNNKNYKHKNYFNNPIEKRLQSNHHKKQRQQYHHEIPNKSILLNHKVYHDDEYRRSEDHATQNNGQPKYFHQTFKAVDIFQPSKPSYLDDNGFKPMIDASKLQNGKLKKLKRFKNSYLIDEHPQESKISQKQILPTLKTEKPQSKFYINVQDETISSSTSMDKKKKPKSQVDKMDPKSKKNPKHFETNVDKKDAAAKAIEDEIRYFQDIYLAHTSPHETEFGHVLETPEKTEERFESNDRKNHRYKGKVKWSNENGEFGQQFWDLGHLGGII